MDIQAAVDRLNSQLPLKARQEQLPMALKVVHELILASLVMEGRAPNKIELRDILGEVDIQSALQRLGNDDLIVLDSAGQKILGAYPVTLEETPHRITVNGHHIYAMCALDAVAIAPMFGTKVVIESQCHLTGAAVRIHMRKDRIVSVKPGDDVMIGIHWQMPTAVAAHSMCMEMVFLKDRPTAESWRSMHQEEVSLFNLLEGFEFGKRFFIPLLK